MTKRKKILIGAAGLLLLAACAATIGISTLGGDWLKSKLVEEARAKLNADLRIDSVSFSPMRGEAELSGVTFERNSELSDVRATVATVKVRVRVRSLLVRKLVLESIEADRPEVRWTIRHPPAEDRKGALEILKKLVFDEQPKKTKRPELRVGRLTIRDGKVDFVSLKEGREPFPLLATGIRYQASDVSFHSFGSIVRGADVEASIDFGGRIARLEKRGTAVPATFSLAGVDLAFADRYFDQTDALVVSAGVLDLGYAYRPEGLLGCTADFRDLALSQNPDSRKKTFYLVPVSALKKLVEARKGAVRLAFSLEEVSASDDLRVLADEVWTAMWEELCRYLTKDAIKDLVHPGKDAPDGEPQVGDDQK